MNFVSLLESCEKMDQYINGFKNGIFNKQFKGQGFENYHCQALCALTPGCGAYNYAVYSSGEKLCAVLIKFTKWISAAGRSKVQASGGFPVCP